MLATREDVVTEARTWLGTPYHHQALIKGVGVDCAMLLVGVYAGVGMIEGVEPRPYPRDWHLHRSEEKYLGWLQSLSQQVPEPGVGDVLVWHFGRTFSHGGIYIGNGEIIHSYLGLGCILGHVDDACFAGRETRAFSLFAKRDGV